MHDFTIEMHHFASLQSSYDSTILFLFSSTEREHEEIQLRRRGPNNLANDFQKAFDHWQTRYTRFVEV